MKTSPDRWPNLTVMNLMVMMQCHRQAAHWWQCPDCAAVRLPPEIRAQSPGYRQRMAERTARQRAALDALVRWRDRQQVKPERTQPWSQPSQPPLPITGWRPPPPEPNSDPTQPQPE